MGEQPFWHLENQPFYPILRGRRSADAAVVGGGLSGLHIAYWLSKAGLRVILLEADTLGSGASGRCAGLVTQAGSLRYASMERLFGPEVCQAFTQTQTAAMQSLRELAAQQDIHGDWRDMDAFLIARDEQDKALLEQEHSAMARAGFSATLTQSTQSPFSSPWSIQIPRQAVLQPLQYIQSLAQKSAKLGLTIFEHSRVTSLETNMVYTQRGSVIAPYVVVATGYPVINTPGWYFTRLDQRKSHLIPLEDSTAFDGIYMDLRERFSLRRYREGMLFHQMDGLVGSRPRESALDVFVEHYAGELTQSTPHHAYGGIDTHSADGLPYIGPYSAKTPNVFVATGYGHRGLVHSVLAAQAISAKILGLPSDGYPLYSGQRKSSGIVRAELKTTFFMAGRYLKGIFRSKAPRCSHMGCKLVYRPRTKTWECPCHGSRFDDIGRVENAPAVHDAAIHHKRKG